MTREPSPAPRFTARILSLLSGKADRLSTPDDLPRTPLALYRSELQSRRDVWADTDEPPRFDAFRGFRDPTNTNA